MNDFYLLKNGINLKFINLCKPRGNIINSSMQDNIKCFLFVLFLISITLFLIGVSKGNYNGILIWKMIYILSANVMIFPFVIFSTRVKSMYFKMNRPSIISSNEFRKISEEAFIVIFSSIVYNLQLYVIVDAILYLFIGLLDIFCISTINSCIWNLFIISSVSCLYAYFDLAYLVRSTDTLSFSKFEYLNSSLVIDKSDYMVFKGYCDKVFNFYVLVLIFNSVLKFLVINQMEIRYLQSDKHIESFSRWCTSQ